ncbi:MAG: AEC family transporter [Kiritimatiellales bacterium]|nr:AEC family transporter [Kiritimatiellales bacterium]
MYVLNSLMPVFLIIALGKLLCRTGFFTDEFARNLNRLTYWVALPALLLDKVTNATFNSGDVVRLSLLLIAATIGSALVGYLGVFLLRIKPRAAGAFVQGAARSNNAFIGLPVILYSMSALTPGIEALATVALAPAIVFYNIFSVSVLLAHSDRKGQSAGKTIGLFGKQLATNPLLISCAVALVMNFFGIRFPTAIQRSLSALGGASLALALLSIGTTLSFKGIGNGLRYSLSAASIKVFIQPLIGLGLALLWKLPPNERQMLLIYLACPTAVVSYVMADIFGSDKELAAHIIVVSTLLSAVSLSIIVAFGG